MLRLRTFGIVAHIDAGKTTLTERILFDTGAQSWIGSVDDGTSAMDWLPEERRRGISIKAAATRVTWGDCVLQIVDTPGHVDFVAEVERCLHVLDGVVVLIDAVRGVESQTEVVWQQALSRRLPRLVFVNKLDRDGADFSTVVHELGERLACRTVSLVVPLEDQEGRFAGLGDAMTGAVQWFDGQPDAAVSARLQAELLAAHERIVELAADVDETILRDALGGRRIAADRLQKALRPDFLAGRLVPVCGGAALWNRGVDWLLDAVVRWLPDTNELPRQGLWSIERAGDPEAPPCAFVFKVQHLDEVWNYVRVVRGRFCRGQAWVRGQRPAEPQPIADLWLLQADRHTSTNEIAPGEIAVLPGEMGLRTGDSVCDPAAPLSLPSPRFPSPVLAVTFEPERAADGPKLAAALRELAVDDPTLRVDRDRERIEVRGMGELHLDIVAERVRARTAVPFLVSKPRVDRRESVVGEGVGVAEVRAVVGGEGCSVRCEVHVAPAADPGLAEVVGVASAASCRVAIEEIRQRVAAGSRVGPIHATTVSLRRAEVLEGQPVEAMLQQAAAKALDQALLAAGIRELEPWVAFEVTAPEEASPAVLADLGARGAQVQGVAAGRLGARLIGRAPLSRMLGYVTKLRSMTKGRGQVWLRPVGHAPVGP